MENKYQKSFQEGFREILTDMYNFAKITFSKNPIESLKKEKQRLEVYEILSDEMPGKYIDALIKQDKSSENLTARMSIDAFVSPEKRNELKSLGVKLI